MPTVGWCPCEVGQQTGRASDSGAAGVAAVKESSHLQKQDRSPGAGPREREPQGVRRGFENKNELPPADVRQRCPNAAAQGQSA